MKTLPLAVAFFTVATASAFAQGLAVAAVSPSRNAVGARPATAIAITFNQPVDPTSVTPQTVKAFGKWSGPVPGTSTLESGNTVIRFTPSRPYFVAESVAVLVSSGVRSSIGNPLTGGFSSVFWVAPAPGSRQWTLQRIIPMRRNGELPVRTYGIFAGDIDRDGSADITAANEISGDLRLLRNDGCGTFGAMTVHAAPGQEPSPTDSADFNGDGWLDVCTGNQNGKSVAVFLNDRNGGYAAPIVLPTGGITHGVAALDADGDGDADVAAPNTQNVLVFFNDGSATFPTSRSFNAGDGEDNVSVGDANGDGKPDLLVGNGTSSNVAVLLNDGAGNFTFKSSRSCGGSPFQNAAGDVDGDGDVDSVTANVNASTFGVVFNDGQGNLIANAAYPVGSAPAAIDLADLDGDGDLDCATSNYGGASYTIYFNAGNGVFGNSQTLASSRAGSCATLVDYDRDGDTDILAADELADEVRLYAQAGPNPAGVQPPACVATLRVNQWAGRAGFGTAPPQPVALGTAMFLGATGAASAPFAVLIGVGASPGLALPYGLLNLGPALPIVPVVNGFAGGPSGVTNAEGEGLATVLIPSALPAGAVAAFQGLVLDATNPAGLTLTNPESIALVP